MKSIRYLELLRVITVAYKPSRPNGPNVYYAYITRIVLARVQNT